MSELWDIVGFKVPEHKSKIYKMFLTRNSLLRAVEEAIDKDVNVISIRKVLKNE